MNTEIIIAGGSKAPLKVKRFGYGAMRLTGEGIWGEPANRPEALQILKQCITSGINFIDTADYYGEDVTNRLIKEALYPYPDDLVICTKVGGARKPDKSWIHFNSPENLRSSIENNLRTLKLEQLKLVHFRAIGGKVQFQESMNAMFEMQKEGKILHVGVSNVSPDELHAIMAMGEIATVENMYGHGQRVSLRQAWGEETRGGEEVLEICEENKIPLIPYFSLINSMPKKEIRQLPESPLSSYRGSSMLIPLRISNASSKKESRKKRSPGLFWIFRTSNIFQAQGLEF